MIRVQCANACKRNLIQYLCYVLTGTHLLQIKGGAGGSGNRHLGVTRMDFCWQKRLCSAQRQKLLSNTHLRNKQTKNFLCNQEGQRVGFVFPKIFCGTVACCWGCAMSRGVHAIIIQFVCSVQVLQAISVMWSMKVNKQGFQILLQSLSNYITLF